MVKVMCESAVPPARQTAHRRGRTMTRFMIALLVLGVVAAGPVRADDDKRSRLMGEIDALLDQMKDKINRVPGSISYYEIEEARGKASEVKSKAGELRDVKGSDSTADRESSYYPGYADDFREAASNLQRMKDAALRQADTRLWEKCHAADRELRDAVASWVDKKDPRGLTEVPKLAEDSQERIGDALRKADDTNKEFDGSRKSLMRRSRTSRSRSSSSAHATRIVRGCWRATPFVNPLGTCNVVPENCSPNHAIGFGRKNAAVLVCRSRRANNEKTKLASVRFVSIPGRLHNFRSKPIGRL